MPRKKKRTSSGKRPPGSRAAYRKANPELTRASRKPRGAAYTKRSTALSRSARKPGLQNKLAKRLIGNTLGPIASLAARTPSTKTRRRGVRASTPTARQRLQTVVVPSQGTDENASRRKTKSVSSCTRKKEVRRGVILASGKGGIHGRRQIRRSTRCRY